ncbi:MAG: alpha,2-mannosyltransferase [Actinomycetota bacterium]|nr:alpha,2-mannosyltransferase [Actinomycetota bacterium]
MALRRATGRPVPVLSALGLLVELTALASGHLGDFDAFVDAGTHLVHGDADVFAGSYLQVGPLYLFVVGVSRLLFGWTGLSDWLAGGLLPAVASVALVLAAARLVARAVPRQGRQMLAGLAVFAGGAMAVPASYGHAEETLVALMLVVGTGAAWSRRPVAPALVLAAAVTIKLWAVVGIGLLLVAAGRRLQLYRLAIFAAATSAAYLPFFVFGHVGTFEMAWQVEIPAPMSLLVPDGYGFGYRQRLVQVAVAAALGVYVALRVRSSDVTWALPVAVIATRLLLDPVPSPYYWAALVLVLVLRVMALQRSVLEAVVLVFAVDIAALLVITLAQGMVGAVALAALALASLVGTARSLQSPAA